MDRIRRNQRLAAMTRILTAAPNRIFTLSTFCEMFQAAKSTLSEDIDILRGVMDAFSLGRLETVTGAAGGVRFRPVLENSQALELIAQTAQELETPGRVLPGGFLYMSDILSQPDLVESMGAIMAGLYYAAEPDFVLTMELKGIPVALMAAKALDVPLVIVRRDNKAYEGPAVNINYLSGSAKRMETMSLSRRAIKGGKRALIIDDFMKAGGTMRGMLDMMREFSVTVVGMCVVMATTEPEQKRVEGVRSLMVMGEVDDEQAAARVSPAPWLEKEG